MRLRLLAVSAVVVLSACGPIHPKPKVKPFPYDGFSATYPSGMRLVAYALPHLREATVSASYRVGSVDDPPGKEGLAHLVEHLAFRAKPDGGPRIWTRLESAGVEFNAFTLPDSTRYDATGRPEDASSLLRIEADRLRDPLAGIAERDFLRERDVVLRELAERRDDSSPAVQLDWLIQRAMPETPYSRVPTEQSIRSITLDDARAFVRRHYTPAHLVLVVSGPGRAEEVARVTQATFGALATGDGASRVAPVPLDAPTPALDDRPPREMLVREAPVERPVLWVGWTVPGDAAKGGPRALAAALFLEAMLITPVVGPHRDRVVSHQVAAHRMAGVSLVFARVELRRAEDGQKIVDAVRGERRFWGGLGGAQFYGAERLRDRLLLENHLQMEALDVSEVAPFVRVTGDPDYLGGWPKAVSLALSTESETYTERYLRSDRLVSLLVVPSDTAKRVVAEHPERAERATDDDHHFVAPDPDVAPGDPLAAGRAPELTGAVRRVLPNGLEVVVLHRPGFHAVQARLVVRTDPSGPREQLLRSLAMSTSAARWNVSSACSDGTTVGESHVQFSSRLPSSLLDDALRTVSCRISFGRSVDGPVFDQMRDGLAEGMEKGWWRVSSVVEDVLSARLFPGHAYGEAVTPAAVRAMRGSEATAWLERTLRPGAATLVLAGDVEPSEELFRKIERRFGGWDRGADRAHRPAAAAPPLPSSRTFTIVDRPGAKNAEIYVAVRVPPRATRDDPAFRALIWRIERDLSSKLRGTKGEVYGAWVDVVDAALGSGLVVGTVAARERALNVVAEMLGELDGLGELPDETIVAQARWQTARRLGLGFGTSARDSARLAELFVHRLPTDEWDTFLARTASLTPERLQRAANDAALGVESVVLVGDAKVLEPSLRARGLAPEVISKAPDAR